MEVRIIEPIRQDFQVNLRYAVHFIRDLFAPDNSLLKDIVCGAGDDLPKKALFVVDSGVALHHPNLIRDIEAYCRRYRSLISAVGPPLVVLGGEEVKNDPRYVSGMQKAIHGAGLCRHSYVVAVGGGAIIDMVGYAAVTAHRGVRLVRVPTTVLAQADAALGVKNGINAFGKKNFIGTFAAPAVVVNDFSFLSTLSQRDWIGGTAEAVKVALIKDGSFFLYLEREAEAICERNKDVMEEVIYRCAALHLDHIATSGDPFELGNSRPLDFGHWSAHKLEQLSGYSLRHGEAVAIGIALDATYSCLSGLLSEGEWQRILDTLQRIGFSLYAQELDHEQVLLDGLEEFREHLGGRLTIMLLTGIGRGVEVNEMDEASILESVAILRERGGVRKRVTRREEGG